MFEVKDHLLSPATVYCDQISNHGGPLHRPPFIVLHYTGGLTMEQTISSFSNLERRASAHLIIDRDGSVAQCVPFDLVAWHAGESSWVAKRSGPLKLISPGKTYTGLNRHSIGIEMVNAGYLTKRGKDYHTWSGARVEPKEVVEMDPSSPESFGRRYWHAYDPKQVATCLAIVEKLYWTYGTQDILRHSDISPGRKVDTGPAFPFDQMRSKILGRNL